MGVHGQKIPKNANVICERPLKVNKSQKNFGKHFLLGKISFFRAKKLSASTKTL